MMLDHIESRMWVTHGKALGDEVGAGLDLLADDGRRLLKRLADVIPGLAPALAALLAGAVTIGVAVLPGITGLGIA